MTKGVARIYSARAYVMSVADTARDFRRRRASEPMDEGVPQVRIAEVLGSSHQSLSRLRGWHRRFLRGRLCHAIRLTRVESKGGAVV